MEELDPMATLIFRRAGRKTVTRSAPAPMSLDRRAFIPRRDAVGLCFYIEALVEARAVRRLDEVLSCLREHSPEVAPDLD